MSKAPQPSNDGVHGSFNKIVGFARDLNTQLQTPEIVFIGKQGCGKSSLIEAFFGHPFLTVSKDKGASTKRAVIINLINNPACEKPKITIKRDPSASSYSEDVVVSIDGIEKELAPRNTVNSSPIYIQYEYKNTWNLTVIDTPGLVGNSEKSEHSDEIEEMVLDFCKPSNRVLIFVEEVKDGSQSEMMLFAKKADPRFDRTTFVFTKFSDQLKNFTTTRDLNRYLSSTAPSEAASFFVSLIPASDRAKYTNKEQYKARLEDLVKEDMSSLEQLQYDRRYANSIGVVAFKRHLLELTYNKYQANIPELLKRLRVMKRKSEESLAHIQQQFKATDNNRLRGSAAKYVMQFLQCIERLLSGTLEGNPSINGQTTSEEKAQDETGEWKDVSHNVIPVDSAEYKIPHADSKLYGGQQFERLLAEFKAVVEHIAMNKLSQDDIATAAGPQKLNSASSCTWAASDIAQRQIQRALLPLIDQLFVRATYIMKRLVNVAEGMMENSKKSRKRGGAVAGVNNSADVEDLDQFPYFTYAVKDLYFKFVDSMADDCKKKCKDEFFCTRLIHWELTNLDGKTLTFPQSQSKEEVKKAVSNLANDLFIKIRDRITKAVLLKSYNYFLVPMQSEVWSEIQGSITSMSDEQLQELFEIAVTRQRLTDAEKDMNGILSKFVEQEHLFLDYTNGFSKLTQKELDL